MQRALRGADAAEEDDRELKWPFGTSDGGPLSRPLLPNLDNVLIAIVDDADEGQRIVTALHELGLAKERVRPYTAEQILAHNEIIRANRGCKGRLIGALVDERKAIADYVAYAREGRSAVWVLVDDRYHANRVIRLMADYGVMLVRYYDDSNRVEDVHMRLPPRRSAPHDDRTDEAHGPDLDIMPGPGSPTETLTVRRVGAFASDTPAEANTCTARVESFSG